MNVHSVWFISFNFIFIDAAAVAAASTVFVAVVVVGFLKWNQNSSYDDATQHTDVISKKQNLNK